MARPTTQIRERASMAANTLAEHWQIVVRGHPASIEGRAAGPVRVRAMEQQYCAAARGAPSPRRESRAISLRGTADRSERSQPGARRHLGRPRGPLGSNARWRSGSRSSVARRLPGGDIDLSIPCLHPNSPSNAGTPKGYGSTGGRPRLSLCRRPSPAERFRRASAASSFSRDAGRVHAGFPPACAGPGT